MKSLPGILITVCLALAPLSCSPPQDDMRLKPLPANSVRTELYFGLGLDGGGVLDTEDWNRFLADEITPRFPDGLTVLDAHGQWRPPGGDIIREPAKVLIIIHAGGPENSRLLDEIRERYRETFGQQSVLRVDQMAHAEF